MGRMNCEGRVCGADLQVVDRRATSRDLSGKPRLQVTIPGLATPIRLVLPAGFRGATTDAERRERSILIESLQNSQSGKAVVADVYLARWGDSARFPLPLLFVGTLPAAVTEQGRIPAAVWAQLRAGLMTQAAGHIPTIEKQLAPVQARLRPRV